MLKKSLILLFIVFTGGLFAQGKVSRTEDEARVFIDSLYKLTVSGKSSFTNLAKLYSEDLGSAKDGGLINHVKLGMLVPEFENIINVSRVGDISTPFKTQYGYHFLQVIEKNPDSYSVRHILITYK